MSFRDLEHPEITRVLRNGLPAGADYDDERTDSHVGAMPLIGMTGNARIRAKPSEAGLRGRGRATERTSAAACGCGGSGVREAERTREN